MFTPTEAEASKAGEVLTKDAIEALDSLVGGVGARDAQLVEALSLGGELCHAEANVINTFLHPPRPEPAKQVKSSPGTSLKHQTPWWDTQRSV